VAYLYRDNCPSNEVDIPHNSQECCHQHVAVNAVGDIDKGSLVQRGGRRAISVTFSTPAGKVTVIGSNCSAYRVGRCVDCEGGRTAQIFSECVVELKLKALKMTSVKMFRNKVMTFSFSN